MTITIPESPQRPVRPGLISARRSVPRQIVRPDYAATGEPGGKRKVRLVKNDDEIARMRRACHAAARVLNALKPHVQPGATTDQIDAVAHDLYIAEGGYPSPLNYHGFPKSICTSVNEVICHGIPDSRKLESGDIVNCDVTIFLDGMHGDCSATYFVGEVAAESRRLVEVTYECMIKGIGVVRPGARIRDIGQAIQTHAHAYGYGVVREYVGHGIGEQFHMEPTVLHYYEPRAKTVIEAGMTFTIEPMITLGHPATAVWDDDWTVVTVDGSRTAQWEHTVLVTKSGVEILTLDPAAAPLAPQ